MTAPTTTEQNASQAGFSQAGFEQFLQSRQQPQWLADLREQAWAAFTELDWPSRREEEWMRTDIRLFNLGKFQLPSEDAPGGEMPEALLSEGVELAGHIQSLNCQQVSSNFSSKWAEKGVIFGGLEELANVHSDLVQKYLFKTNAIDDDRFSALHASCWAGGAFLYVPRGVVVDEPFHVIAGLTDGQVDLSHTLIILEEGAEATFLSELTSDDDSSGGLHCGGIELVLAAGANLRFVNLQNWGKGVWHFARQKATVGQDANLQWTAGAIGSRLSKVNQHVELNGKGANCQVNGVLFTEDKQHLSYHTLQHHKAPHCTSDFLYKAALQDKSRTVWRGMIKVDTEAQLTDGYQRNDNLLLSGNARADAIPGLEIEADDVRCTHGSTSGRVDEELIFYARARGFTRKEAIRMIVNGFFQQVFDRITIESVRNALSLAVARRVRDYE